MRAVAIGSIDDSSPRCRCGVRALPELPQAPTGSPRRTVWPTATSDRPGLQVHELGVDVRRVLDDHEVATQGFVRAEAAACASARAHRAADPGTGWRRAPRARRRAPAPDGRSRRNLEVAGGPGARTRRRPAAARSRSHTRRSRGGCHRRNPARRPRPRRRAASAQARARRGLLSDSSRTPHSSPSPSSGRRRRTTATAAARRAGAGRHPAYNRAGSSTAGRLGFDAGFGLRSSVTDSVSSRTSDTVRDTAT